LGDRRRARIADINTLFEGIRSVVAARANCNPDRQLSAFSF
jgi:hypothetical protein